MSARNPILDTTAGRMVADRFARLSPEAQHEIREFCRWLYRHAREQAELSWIRSKAPMAVYWKAVAAWSYHIAVAIGRIERQREERERIETNQLEMWGDEGRPAHPFIA